MSPGHNNVPTALLSSRAPGIVGIDHPTIPRAESEQVHLVRAGAADMPGPPGTEEPVGGDQHIEVTGVILDSCGETG